MFEQIKLHPNVIQSVNELYVMINEFLEHTFNFLQMDIRGKKEHHFLYTFDKDRIKFKNLLKFE